MTGSFPPLPGANQRLVGMADHDLGCRAIFAMGKLLEGGAGFPWRAIFADGVGTVCLGV
jgi:hypothetical protein